MAYARIPLPSIETMHSVMRASIAQQRFNMLLLCAFGLIALALGGAGLYGVMSHTAAGQKKDIGVRMALGAQRGDILSMILQEAGVLLGTGLIIGITTSVAGAQLLRSLLFGVAPRDPITLVSCAVLLVTGLFAAWWPARRAVSTKPRQAYGPSDVQGY